MRKGRGGGKEWQGLGGGGGGEVSGGARLSAPGFLDRPVRAVSVRAVM